MLLNKVGDTLGSIGRIFLQHQLDGTIPTVLLLDGRVGEQALQRLKVAELLEAGEGLLPDVVVVMSELANHRRQDPLVTGGRQLLHRFDHHRRVFALQLLKVNVELVVGAAVGHQDPRCLQLRLRVLGAVRGAGQGIKHRGFSLLGEEVNDLVDDG